MIKKKLIYRTMLHSCHIFTSVCVYFTYRPTSWVTFFIFCFVLQICKQSKRNVLLCNVPVLNALE